MKNDTTPFFTATLDRKEGRNAVLIFTDGQELVVPLHYLARQAKEGDIIHLNFMTDHEAKAEKADLARHLLEEILNGK